MPWLLDSMSLFRIAFIFAFTHRLQVRQVPFKILIETFDSILPPKQLTSSSEEGVDNTMPLQVYSRRRVLKRPYSEEAPKQ